MVKFWQALVCGALPFVPKSWRQSSCLRACFVTVHTDKTGEKPKMLTFVHSGTFCCMSSIHFSNIWKHRMVTANMFVCTYITVYALLAAVCPISKQATFFCTAMFI